MKLPMEGTNELSKDGFYYFLLKVTFSRSNLAVLKRCANFLKNGPTTFLICIQFLGDDIDQLSRDGFD